MHIRKMLWPRMEEAGAGVAWEGGEGGSRSPLRRGGRPGEVWSPRRVQWTRAVHTGDLRTERMHAGRRGCRVEGWLGSSGIVFPLKIDLNPDLLRTLIVTMEEAVLF